MHNEELTVCTSYQIFIWKGEEHTQSLVNRPEGEKHLRDWSIDWNIILKWVLEHAYLIDLAQARLVMGSFGWSILMT